MSKTVNSNVLRPHQHELKQLGELAGIYMHPTVFSNVVELLNMGFDAETVYNLLKTIKKSTDRKSRTSSGCKSRASTVSSVKSVLL